LLVVDSKPVTLETLENSSTGGPAAESNELVEKEVVWDSVQGKLNYTA